MSAFDFIVYKCLKEQLDMFKPKIPELEIYFPNTMNPSAGRAI